MESLAVGLPKIKVPQAHPGNSDEEDPQPRSSRPNIFPSCSISNFILTLAFIFLVSLTFGGIVFSLVWLTFKAETPTLWLNSLSVSKTKSSTLTTKYDVGFTYNNPNRIWEMEFDHVEVYLFHERTHCLAITTMERFHIGVKNEKCMNASLGDGAPCFGGDSVLEEIKQAERKNETAVNFNIFVTAKLTFECSLWLLWKQNGIFIFSCSDIKFSFANATAGRFIGGVPKMCKRVW